MYTRKSFIINISYTTHRKNLVSFDKWYKIQQEVKVNKDFKKKINEMKDKYYEN